MKPLTTLISALFFLTLGISQSWALPKCSYANTYKEIQANWHNCTGDWINKGLMNDSGYKKGEIVYSGDWKNGVMSGQGTFFLPNGGKFVGGFKKGKWHGRGLLYFNNKKRIEGNFKNSKLDGFAKYYDADGTTINKKKTGIYKAGKFIRAQENPPKKNVINRAALTLKGISLGMNVKQRRDKLINSEGYSCSDRGDYYSCVLGDAEIKMVEDMIEFNCQSFNICDYKLREAASQLSDYLKLPNGMNYDPEILYMADAEIPRYCGRGKAGDVLCVKELFMLFPLTIILKKGSMDGGGANFD